MIILGADHGGYHLKEDLVKYFESQTIPFLDFSAPELDPKDDYPPIAFRVGEEVVKKNAKGILICGSGIGISIAANKVKGVRAAPLKSVTEVILARLHNDLNILCFNGLEFEKEAEEALLKGNYQNLLSLKPRKRTGHEVIPLVEAFLNTPFEGGRHQKRVSYIENYEKS